MNLMNDRSGRTQHRRSRIAALIVAALCNVGLVATALGHHSYAATYDAKQPVTVEGVITKMAWRNPHAFLYVDAKDGTGATVNWALELSPVSMLIRYKLKPDMLKVGDRIKVHAFRAKDGTKHLAAGHKVTLSDGQTFIVGPGDVARPEVK
jgi:hypothetical protein